MAVYNLTTADYTLVPLSANTLVQIRGGLV